jgi:hypothetical protein
VYGADNKGGGLTKRVALPRSAALAVQSSEGLVLLGRGGDCSRRVRAAAGQSAQEGQAAFAGRRARSAGSSRGQTLIRESRRDQSWRGLRCDSANGPKNRASKINRPAAGFRPGGEIVRLASQII